MEKEMKRKKISLNPFVDGFSSVLNISGPDTNEYLKYFEASSKKSLQNTWNKVGETIQKSMNSTLNPINK